MSFTISFIGAGSTLLPNIVIGSNSVVGAGTVVTTNIPNNSLVFGNPARIIKQEINGYNNVSVWVNPAKIESL